MFGFGKKEKQIKSINMSTVDGVADLPRDIVVNLELLEDKLQIKVKFGNKPPIFLSYDQIVNVAFMTEQEVIEKSKSVVGRAVAGGLIFGGLGAVIGGMSGTGTKQQKKQHLYLIINYNPADGGDAKALSFKPLDLSFGLDGFTKELKQLCGILPAPTSGITL